MTDHFQMDLLDGERGDGDADGSLAPRIRVSTRARRLALRVYPDARVEVVVPPRARPREVESFIAAHREWIEDKRAQALRNRPAPEVFPPARIDFALAKQSWRVHLAGGSGRLRLTQKAGEGGDILEISGAWTRAALRKSLLAWLMKAALRQLEPRVAALSAATGIPYSRVSVRRQRSRWGSCSARGTISLNACLLFQRPEVVEYLIIHELAHVRHMNHSARFWQLVERHCADWRALDRELVQGWRRVPQWPFQESQSHER